MSCFFRQISENHDVASFPSPPHSISDQAAQRFQMVSELTSDFAYCFGVTEDGTLILEWMTDSVTRITGHTVEEINQRGWLSFMYAEDLSIIGEHWERLLAGEAHVAEFRAYSGEENVLWLRNHARPVWEARQQRVTQIYGAAQDITAAKEAQAVQARLLEQLAQERREIEALNLRLCRNMRQSFHRIKNNLQQMSCLIKLQAGRHQGGLPPEKVQHLHTHPYLLAEVHHLLTQEVRPDGKEVKVSARSVLERLIHLLQQTTGSHLCIFH